VAIEKLGGLQLARAMSMKRLRCIEEGAAMSRSCGAPSLGCGGGKGGSRYSAFGLKDLAEGSLSVLALRGLLAL